MFAIQSSPIGWWYCIAHANYLITLCTQAFFNLNRVTARRQTNLIHYQVLDLFTHVAHFKSHNRLRWIGLD